MWEGITQFFRAWAETLGFMKQKDAQKNAPDVKAAKIAKQEQAEKDRIIKNVSKGDLDEIRKDAA